MTDTMRFFFPGGESVGGGELRDDALVEVGDIFLTRRTLWAIQILLALLFLFAGAAKFFMPVDQMTKGMPAALASGSFIHFIGLCEVLGGLGLILPGLLRIKAGLTPLAASGLVIIMIGATVLSIPQGVGMAVFPMLIGILAAFVAYGRWRLAPLLGRTPGCGLGPGQGVSSITSLPQLLRGIERFCFLHLGTRDFRPSRILSEVAIAALNNLSSKRSTRMEFDEQAEAALAELLENSLSVRKASVTTLRPLRFTLSTYGIERLGTFFDSVDGAQCFLDLVAREWGAKSQMEPQ